MKKVFKALKTPLICLAIIVSSIFVGFLLLALSYCLPTGERTEDNMKKTAVIMTAEGTYPVVSQKAFSSLDNFTDSLMLMTASDPGDPDRDSFGKAIDTRFPQIADPEQTPRSALSEHYLGGEPFVSYWKYNHYWHGYLVFLRPLIRLTDYHNIRILNLVVQVVLIILAICLMVRRGRKCLIIPLLIFYGSLMPLASAKSLQFSACFYVTMFAILALLKMKEYKPLRITLLFLVTGIFTAYFDLLTFPIITLGVPLALYLFLKNERDIKSNIIDILKSGITWSIGYLGMWCGKWIIGGQSVMNTAFKEIFLWTNTSENVNLLDKWKNSIEVNWYNFTDSPAFFYFQIFCVVMITLIIVEIRNKKKKDYKAELKRVLYTALPFIIVSLISIAWFCVASGHCSHHNFMTFKIYTIFTVSIMLGLLRVYSVVKKPLKK